MNSATLAANNDNDNDNEHNAAAWPTFSVPLKTLLFYLPHFRHESFREQARPALATTFATAISITYSVLKDVFPGSI